MARSNTQEEILRTLENINRTAANTDEISTATAGLISSQGEQIRHISHNATSIEANLNTSERLIRGIKSWGGKISNMFSGDAGVEKFPAYLPTAAVKQPVEGSTQSSTSSSRYMVAPPPSSSFDQQVDRQLDHISGVIANIKEKSLAISADVSQQVYAVESADTSIARSADRVVSQHNVIKTFR